MGKGDDALHSVEYSINEVNVEAKKANFKDCLKALKPFPNPVKTNLFCKLDLEMRARPKHKINDVGYSRKTAEDLCIYNDGLSDEAECDIRL